MLCSVEVSMIKVLIPLVKYFYLPFQGGTSFVDILCVFFFC